MAGFQMLTTKASTVASEVATTANLKWPFQAQRSENLVEVSDTKHGQMINGDVSISTWRFICYVHAYSFRVLQIEYGCALKFCWSPK